MLILHMMLGLAVAAQAAAEAGAEDAAARAAAKEAAAEQAKMIARHCKARRFEAVVDLPVNGGTRPSRIRMCGKEGQTDAEWVRTLRDGAKKLVESDDLPKSAKDQAIAAIEAEIAKFEPAAPDPVSAAVPIAPGPGSIPPLTVPPAPATTLPAAAYSALPPLDQKPVAPAADYSALPPLHAATEPAAAAAARPASAPARPPRLTLSCIEFGDSGPGGACTSLRPDTVISVRADEPLAAGRLRFLRRGETRGELALPAMAAGQSRKFRLPSRLCTGVVRTEVQIEVRGTAAQPADLRGPFNLRC